MEKQPPNTTSEDSVPEELAFSTPRDLYPTSDIRFVMLEIGKLTSKVDRLVDDVKSQSAKIDKLRMTVAWVGGGAAVLLFLLTIFSRAVPMPRISFDGPAPIQAVPSAAVPAPPRQ